MYGRVGLRFVLSKAGPRRTRESRAAGAPADFPEPHREPLSPRKDLS
jgi:hypothetical protein